MHLYTPPPTDPTFKLWTHEAAHAVERPRVYSEPTNRIGIESRAWRGRGELVERHGDESDQGLAIVGKKTWRRP